MAIYNVFGNGTPSYPVAAFNDATSAATVANVFYMTNTNGTAIGWRCTGGRIYIPNDPLVTNKSITIMAWMGDSLNPLNLTLAPRQQVVTTTPVSGGWCEVTWDESFSIDYGPQFCWVAIGYKFNDVADQLCYIAASGLPALDSAAIPSVSVGSTLMLAEVVSEYKAWKNRGSYYFEGEPDPYGVPIWYGADIIVDSEPVEASIPVGAYGFNEGSGMVATDSSGNSNDLDIIDTTNYTLNGHNGAGFTQSVADPYGIWTSLPGINVTENPEVTMMFWGKRESDGSLGDSWTVRQTAFGTSNTAWGIKMSDGTNSIAEFFIQGFPIILSYPKQPLGEWHHYAITTNGHTVRFYVDSLMVGEQGASGAVGGGPLNDDNILVFGGEMQQQTIDDLRIFDHALTPNQIAYFMALDITSNNREGKVKVWDGAAWNTHPMKVWDGTAWTTRPVSGTTDGVNFVRGKD